MSGLLPLIRRALGGAFALYIILSLSGMISSCGGGRRAPRPPGPEEIPLGEIPAPQSPPSEERPPPPPPGRADPGPGAAERGSTVPGPTVPGPSFSELLIPVQGVLPAALQDSFDDPRDDGDRVHRAIDIPAPRGAPVVAAAAGRIVRLFENDLGGLSIHQIESTGLRGFYYAHLDAYARGLRPGQKVERGEVIAYVGTTGNAPRSFPHLHFAVYRLGSDRRISRGQPINPYPLLTRPAGRGAGRE